ncbi:hypothetical protein JZ785_27045 [Alicyclobacillus curvatus]|nr:hypothetical protein JZ785_27045 [Alicyclobacillus curvatus]
MQNEAITTSLNLMEQCLRDTPATTEDRLQIDWIQKRALTSLRSVRLLIANDCYADAMVIQRVILEHVARLAYMLKHVDKATDWRMMKYSNKPSVSSILNEVLGNNLMYSWLSAFTHPDVFSLSMEDRELNDVGQTEGTIIFSVVASTLMILLLIAEAFPSMKERIEPQCMSLMPVMLTQISNVTTLLPNISTKQFLPYIPELIANKEIAAGLSELLASVNDLDDLRDIVNSKIAAYNPDNVHEAE